MPQEQLSRRCRLACNINSVEEVILQPHLFSVATSVCTCYMVVQSGLEDWQPFPSHNMIVPGPEAWIQ